MVSSPAWAQTPDAPVPGAPRVHIETPDPDAILFRVPTAEERGRLGAAYQAVGVPVCRPPCDGVVDGRGGRVFFVRSDREDILPSPAFTLPARRASVRVEVTPGSRGRRYTGLTLTVVGGVMMGAGVASAIVGATSPGFDETSTKQNGAQIAGYVFVVTGLVTLVTGIAVTQANKTTVDIARGGIPLGKSARLDGLTLRF
jgi:hypothetical protein